MELFTYKLTAVHWSLFVRALVFTNAAQEYA